VEGDPEQLHQVFINLLLNAIESMPQGGSLSVAAQCDGGSNGQCRVLFSDSGPGIPPSVIGKIFEPFVTSKERGTGLGLAVSRRIVEEHGGKLTGVNRPEGGAVFVVELPTSIEDRSHSQSDAAGRADEMCGSRNGSSKHDGEAADGKAPGDRR
jgi:two-component system, NtrC family, sensor histidine kinase HydH